MGAFTGATEQKRSMDSEPIDRDFTHTVLGEFFTVTTCVPCKYVARALKELFNEGYWPFNYITYVFNKNNNSKMRKSELVVVATPTTCWDGDYIRNTKGEGTEEEKARFNESIQECGARNVKDIDLDLNVEWLGAVNPVPADGEIAVPIEIVFYWNTTEMKIDVAVTNNEASEYDGHLHVQITEVESSLWNDKFDDPYTHEFKDYALNQDLPLDAGETWSTTKYWDGVDYDDKGGANWNPHKFDYITQDNIMVVAAVFDKENDKYVDECAGFRTGVGTDPKKFDVYFGTTYPPPKVVSNGSAMRYDPLGSNDLNWTTKYYWRVDQWNAKGELTTGEDLDFITRGNNPPYLPRNEVPKNGTGGHPIDTNLSWLGGDPENDATTYDVYFGEYNPLEDPPIVAHNITETIFDPTPTGTLDFEKTYAWRIVAWDYYGEMTKGEKWEFTTEENKPPNKAKDPKPPDGSKNVPGNSLIRWNGSDPNSGDILEYDVYFGPNPDPPLAQNGEGLTQNWYDPYGTGEMPIYEDFYWKILTRDKLGLETMGDEWSFTTGINEKPSNPVIDGPHEGAKEIAHDFTFVSWDPLEQKIMYEVKWGDDSKDETDYYESNQTVTLNHSWAKTGTYIIEARAIDEFGEPSEDWTQHEIKIPRARSANYNNIVLNWLFERFPYMLQLIKKLLGL